MLKRVCCRCKNEVTKSVVEGYNYSCEECYEDLYTFETELIEIDEEAEK